jgi:replicative DNA helicase
MNAPDRHVDERGLVVPPQAIEAEQSVLGALLLDNDAIDRIPELRPDHFYRYDHRIIFEHIARMIIIGRRADVITTYEALGTSGKDEQVGGLSYLNALAQNVPGSAGIRRYAEIVMERAQLRGILCAVDEIGAMVHNRSGKTAAEIIAAAQERFEPLADARSFEPKEVGPVLTVIVEGIDARYHGAELEVVSTGFRDLDAKMGGGMRGSELIIVAGRPSMGKTAFSMNIGVHVARNGGVVLVFSLEMSAEALHQRNIANVGGIHLGHILDGKQIVEADWPRLTHAVQVMSEMQMLVDDASGLSLAEIVSRSRAVKRRAGRLDLIIVDYLGLMTGGTDESQNLRIASYSAGLKGLAKQLDVPVIALSQLNRGVEQRPNKRPNMGDLRDSGAIEQDADVILMLYRDEVYAPDTPDRGTAEIIVGKQRNGETGTVRLAFIGEHQKFADLAQGYVPAPRQAPEKSRKGFE